jgi:ribosomal protein S18 acetylase RimI-like enzyme
MAGALVAHPASGTATTVARGLTPRDVAGLRLADERTRASVRQALERYPGRSVWVPATFEYALLGPWRNRPEIACIEDLVAVRHTELLLRAALERCVQQGDTLLLAIELESAHGRSRFERGGLELLEEVITYEIDTGRAAQSVDRSVRIVPVAAGDTRSLSRILAIDETAFPWLWRNNWTEFESYLTTPGVDVFMVEADGEPAGYTGATVFPGWGHLDRIAVAPQWQGHGFGRAALIHAVAAMRQKGARRVALSTQRTNWRSQRLYEQSGFRRTPDLDYQLFGAWCGPVRDMAASGA